MARALVSEGGATKQERAALSGEAERLWWLASGVVHVTQNAVYAADAMRPSAALTWLLIYTQASAFVTKPLARHTSSSALRAEISVVLEKPLGLLLEEDENEKGVYVKEILDSGSAASCDDINEGWRVVSAGGIECAELNLEQVMAAIGSAPSPVELRLKSTTCLLKVVDPDKGSTFVSAQIGDNLRSVLLQSGAKIYDFKGVLTNCNGGGQ